MNTIPIGITVMDVSNAYNDEDTPAERAVKASQAREEMRKRTNVPSNKIDYRQKRTSTTMVTSFQTDDPGHVQAMLALLKYFL